ncbi:hypothetical protein OCH239_17980 [Roseivivax halodurans JCM 10272]|uniref:Uncharacterized protein n=1 Tax=Roseivivax halodurans JCM 10272 TaxID=1449350 RepID=X7EGQ4_9RHOB|nr:hypothetical protein OCH239_17980 [Roseivivax halodurans JCM 10272]
MRVGAGDHDLSGLDWLAQRLEHLAREFRELVHEEDAVMREADLTRLGPPSTADDRRLARRVVRLAERAFARDTSLVEKAGERMDHRCLERLERGKQREEPRHTRREHRLSRSRRSHHHQMMAARRRDLERPLGFLLPLHVPKIAYGGRGRDFAGLTGGEHGLTGEMLDHVKQRSGPDDPAGIDPRSLGSACFGT